METYYFENDKIDNEFIEKMKDDYVIREITIYLDKQVEEITKYYYVLYQGLLVDYFDNVEYYNNSITFKCFHANNLSIDNKIKIFYLNNSNDENYIKIDINKFDIKINKPLFIIKQFYDDNVDSDKDYKIIKSNYFKNINELLNYYYHDINDKTYDMCLKYILNQPITTYNKIDENTDEIIIYRELRINKFY